MPLVRIWYKRNLPNSTKFRFDFVAESEVIIDEAEDVGHVVLEADQLLILRDRIDESLKEIDDEGGKEN
jgi:hypothetical protein